MADDLSIDSQTIYIYYGNADATTISNGDKTFLSFDDFDYEPITIVDEPTNPTREPDDPWEATVVASQSDFHHNGKYISWYRGNFGANSRLGFEDSDDGIKWTPWAGNPLFGDTLAVFPYVLQDGDKFYMFVKRDDYITGTFIFMILLTIQILK